MAEEFNKETCREFLMLNFETQISVVNASDDMEQFNMRYWTAHGIADSMYFLELITVKENCDLDERLFHETWPHRYNLMGAAEGRVTLLPVNLRRS